MGFILGGFQVCSFSFPGSRHLPRPDATPYNHHLSFLHSLPDVWRKFCWVEELVVMETSASTHAVVTKGGNRRQCCGSRGSSRAPHPPVTPSLPGRFQHHFLPFGVKPLRNKIHNMTISSIVDVERLRRTYLLKQL